MLLHWYIIPTLRFWDIIVRFPADRGETNCSVAIFEWHAITPNSDPGDTGVVYYQSVRISRLESRGGDVLSKMITLTCIFRAFRKCHDSYLIYFIIGMVAFSQYIISANSSTTT